MLNNTYRYGLFATLISYSWQLLISAQQVQQTQPTQPNTQQQTDYRAGVTFPEQAAMSIADAVNRLKHAPNGRMENIIVKGQVTAVCQKKGCWMLLEDRGVQVRVFFKDYAFFVPKDIAGKTAYAKGTLKWQTFSASQIQHMQKEAGHTASPTTQTTNPESQTLPVFVAEGVVIKDYYTQPKE